jgi:hypothetical protein
MAQIFFKDTIWRVMKQGEKRSLQKTENQQDIEVTPPNPLIIKTNRGDTSDVPDNQPEARCHLLCR